MVVFVSKGVCIPTERQDGYFELRSMSGAPVTLIVDSPVITYILERRMSRLGSRALRYHHLSAL